MNIDWLHDETNQATDITKLREKVDRLQRENGDLKQHNKEQEEENRKLKEENRKLRDTSPECLQNIVVELKKNETKKSDLQEDELGYEFVDGTYLRTMYVLERPYSSVRELVANLVVCSFKVKRKKKKADEA